MKTPREILLERHRNAERKLDAIRCNAVAAAFRCRPQSRRGFLSTLNTQVSTLFHELIWRARHAWAGLAAAWVFIAIANYNLSGGRPATTAKDSKPAPDIFLVWREQERVLDELVDRTETKAAEPPKPVAPQPRSERRLFQIIG